MFNPQVTFDLDKTWARMSSIYNFLDPADKLMIETMWTALFEGLAALFYNLAQAQLAPLQALGNGYLEDSYNTIPIFNKGTYKSIKKEFDISASAVSRLIQTESTYYILADQYIYSLIDNIYWIDHHTQDSSLLFDDITVLENVLYGVVNRAHDNGHVQGLYLWEDKGWKLVWKQEDIQQITVYSGGGYLVRKSSAAGYLVKISENEPFYSKGFSITSVAAWGKTLDFREHPGTSTAWLLMEHALYKGTGLSSNQWTWTKVTGLPDTTIFQTVEYYTGGFAIVATSTKIVAVSMIGNTFAGSPLGTLDEIYTDEFNVLYEGTVTAAAVIYLNIDTGLLYAGDKVQYDSKWWSGVTYVEGTSVQLVPVQHYSYTKDGVQYPLNKTTEHVVSITNVGNVLYVATEKHLYHSNNGTSLDLHGKSLTKENFTEVIGSSTDLKIATTKGVFSAPVYVAGTLLSTFSIFGSSPEQVTLNDNYYLSIPALVGAVTNTQLTEGIDYEIQDFNRLRFLKSIDNTGALTNSSIGLTGDGENFYLISGIYLNPSIPGIYFPAFGEKYPRVALDARRITPYVSGYNSLPTYHAKQKVWAKHLANFCWAGANALRAQPTMKNFERGYSIMRGLPFSYQNEYYDSKWSAGGNNYLKTLISGTTDSYFTYEVGSPASFKTYSGNQYIPRHDILVSGVKFYDYVTDEDLITTLSDRKLSSLTTISGLTPHTHIYNIDAQGNGSASSTGISGLNGLDVSDHMHYITNSLVGPANGVDGEHIHGLPVLNIEEKYHILGINISNTNKHMTFSANMLQDYVQNTTPAIYFKKEFNRAPTVYPSSDKKFYNYSSIPVLNALTSDPENDILYYRWVYQGPFTSSDGGFHEPVISGITSQSTQTSLTQPLVDTKMTFKVEVSDDFNRVSRPIDIYVSGQYNFDNWGHTEFKIEDLNIDFGTQKEMNT